MNNNKSRLFLFWKIGKCVCEKQNNIDYVVKKYSDYLSYYYGNSFNFTRENIHLMKKFYYDFPVFYEKLEYISWEQYKLLFKIENKKERLFYFYLSVLFKCNYEETLDFIYNEYYIRI